MRKTVTICDNCETQYDSGAKVIVRYSTSRKEIHADVCDDCLQALPFTSAGETKNRAGRKPVAA
jgi:uncharacterized protein YqfB (UPF0267 family)